MRVVVDLRLCVSSTSAACCARERAKMLLTDDLLLNCCKERRACFRNMLVVLQYAYKMNTHAAASNKGEQVVCKQVDLLLFVWRGVEWWCVCVLVELRQRTLTD